MRIFDTNPFGWWSARLRGDAASSKKKFKSLRHHKFQSEFLSLEQRNAIKYFLGNAGTIVKRTTGWRILREKWEIFWVNILGGRFGQMECSTDLSALVVSRSSAHSVPRSRLPHAFTQTWKSLPKYQSQWRQSSERLVFGGNVSNENRRQLRGGDKVFVSLQSENCLFFLPTPFNQRIKK